MGFEDVGWSQNKTKTHGITKIKEQRNQNKKQTNKQKRHDENRHPSYMFKVWIINL